MGLWENVKNIMSLSGDDFEDEITEQVTENENRGGYASEPVKKTQPRIFRDDRKKNATSSSASQMQVVLVRPDRFDDVTAIADHLNAQKSVVLNLEATNRDTARRIIDFLGGVAYANGGSIRKVANSTYMIAPSAVDVLGEPVLDDFSDSSIY